MQQAHHSSVVEHLLHLLACNRPDALRQQHRLGTGKDTLPSYSRRLIKTEMLRQAQKLSKEQSSAFSKNILSIFLKRKLQNKTYFMIILILVNSIRLEASSGQLTRNLEKYMNSLRSQECDAGFEFFPFIVQLDYF